MSKTYKNPPLKEAVLEIRFEGSSNYNDANVNNYAEAVKVMFPLRREAARNEVTVKIDQKTGSNQVDKTVTKFETFFSDDEKYLVQIENNRLSIHRFRPYTSWEDYSAKIKKAISAYVEHIGLTPVSRIGIRYINEITGMDSETKDVFTLDIVLPEKLNGEIKSFFSGMTLEIEGNNKLRINIGDKKNQMEKIFVLDLDYFNETKMILQKDDIITWIEKAHSAMDIMFESFLTAKAKEAFNQ